jgi:Protein of unknown function (DUF2752)
MLVLASVAVWTLRTFPPWQYRIYLVCPIRALTGWRCPGCGTTHAIAALLAGRFADAWHYNAMATIAYPLLALVALIRLYSGLRWNQWRSRGYRELRTLIIR